MRADYLWAKKSSSDGRFQWLSLTQHLEDTKNVAGLLWQHWLSDGQRGIITQTLNMDDETAQNFACFLATIHDLGKATPAFQTKKGYVDSQDLDQALFEQMESAGFNGISHLQLLSSSQSPHAIASQALLIQYGLSEDIASIVGAHHGKPVDNDEQWRMQIDSFPSNYYQVENEDESIHQIWDETQRELYEWALQQNGFSKNQVFPEIPKAIQVILSGFLIMADWIASNEYYFPLKEIGDFSVDDGEERLIQGWQRWSKTDIWQPLTNTSIDEIYEKRFKFLPRNIQSVLSTIIDNTSEPGIFILEAPMGIGKTEAAFVAVEQLAFKTGRSGLFFGLPTQATSNGIFPRVFQWLDSVEKESGETASIRLAHGKAALNDQFSSIATNVNIDEGEEAGVIINTWFSGRKTTALDDFVIGTIDQFLLLALKQKHLALRHLGMSKKVVVVDEVHAYDAYMNQYLGTALQWMGMYGVPVVILSATLPYERREELIKSYMRGKTESIKSIRNTLKTFQKDAYPLITYTDGHQVYQETEFIKEGTKSINIRSLNEETLYDQIDKWFKNDGIIGIIVNTVKRAQEITRECDMRYGKENVILLHSNFIATDRAQREKELIASIGKGAKRPAKKIIIGTQVLEQSLDIDLDVLITDLAPMDLLIQRIGRLHRHSITRAEQFQIPTTYVMGLSEDLIFEQGASAIYGGYLLTRTQYFLEDTLEIPDAISTLVQKVYGDEELQLSTELEEAYKAYKEKHFSELLDKEMKAKVYRIEEAEISSNPWAPNSLVGWLKNDTVNQSEEKAYAQVRDTEESIEVIALKKRKEGYSIFGMQDELQNRIDENVVAKEIAKQTLTLPRVLATNYAIAQTIQELEINTAQLFPEWQSQPWLKGAVGILFDDNNEAIINNVKLSYDQHLGLTHERM